MPVHTTIDPVSWSLNLNTKPRFVHRPLLPMTDPIVSSPRTLIDLVEHLRNRFQATKFKGLEYATTMSAILRPTRRAGSSNLLMGTNLSTDILISTSSSKISRRH